MSLYPWFAALAPEGTFHLQVDYAGGGGTNIEIVLSDMYYLPSKTHANSIWTQLLTKLQTVHASFDISFAVSASLGYVATISAASAFILDYTNTLTTGDGKLDLRMFGLPLADTSSGTSLATTRFPAYCWAPRAILDDRGWTPYQYRAFATQAESGAVSVVDHEPRSPFETRPQWRHIVLDAVRGVAAARLQSRRTIDTEFPWATAAGLTTAEWAAALDAPGGWWRATIGGNPWIMVSSVTDAGVGASFDTGYLAGPYVFAGDGGGAPCSMSGWAVLGPPNVVKTTVAGGFRTVEFCALEAQGRSVSQLAVSP